MKLKYFVISLFIIINIVIIIDKVESQTINNDNEKEVYESLKTIYNKYSPINDEIGNASNDGTRGKCKAPMIYANISDNDLYVNERLCLDECCLPCPIADNLYKTDELRKIYSNVNWIRIVSFVCEIFIVITYLVLPNKREHPGITVLFFNVSLLMFLGVSLKTFGGYDRSMCYNEVTLSTFENNPFFCGLQGLALVFSTFSLVLWCFLLIAQLHFQTVWNSNFIKTRYRIFQIAIFLISSSFTLLIGATKQIDYEFGPYCMINSENKYWYFWYPLASFVIPGFTMHIWTIIHMVQMYLVSLNTKTVMSNTLSITSNKTGKEILNVLRIQWRLLMLAVTYLLTYIVYQLFVVLEASKLEVLKLPKEQQPEWLLNWFNCIILGNGQDVCSQYSIPNIANIILLTTAETLTSTLGISMFVIFCSSKNLWKEWRDFLVKLFSFKKNNDDF